VVTAWWVTPVGVLLVVLVWCMRASRPPAQVLAGVALVGYLTWLAGAAFFPVPLHQGSRVDVGCATVLADVRLTPFASIRELAAHASHWQSMRILAGNVAVFVPIGLLLPVAAPRLASWPRMIAAALAVSVAIESGQLAVSLVLGFSYRVTEIDDVILNVPGVLAGFVLYLAALRPRATRPTVARPGTRC
jgi:glycopeptide antibiotics resistance protein